MIQVLWQDIDGSILESDRTSVLTRIVRKPSPGGPPLRATKIITPVRLKRLPQQQRQRWRLVLQADRVELVLTEVPCPTLDPLTPHHHQATKP